MNRKLIVMDYSVGEVHIFSYERSSTEEEEVFDFLSQHHNEQGGSFKSSQINWMMVDMNKSEERLPLYIH